MPQDDQSQKQPIVDLTIGGVAEQLRKLAGLIDAGLTSEATLTALGVLNHGADASFLLQISVKPTTEWQEAFKAASSEQPAPGQAGDGTDVAPQTEIRPLDWTDGVIAVAALGMIGAAQRHLAATPDTDISHAFLRRAERLLRSIPNPGDPGATNCGEEQPPSLSGADRQARYRERRASTSCTNTPSS